MPHSGGGGSHSGGSHSSSHSSGGSHSRGSSYRASSTPFAGSRTYIVYNNSSSPRVVYSNNPDYKEGVSKSAYYGTAIFCSFFIIPGLIAVLIAIGLFFSSFSIGYKKTKIPDFVNQRIVVSDISGGTCLIICLFQIITLGHYQGVVKLSVGNRTGSEGFTSCHQVMS